MGSVRVMGSANLDLVATTDRLPGPGETVLGETYHEHAGGKGLNQAVAAARAGATVSFEGAIGDDAAGDALAAVMSADGIDATLVDRLQGTPTGRALIGVSAAGENSIIVVPGANATVTGGRPLSTETVVLAQLEVPIEAVVRAFTAARAAGATTVLNPAPARALSSALLSLCDLVIPNEHEAALLGGVDHLLELGATAIVVTLGSKGSSLVTMNGATPIAPFDVEPVDTTAAGDTFCGALCARLAAGDSIPDAARYASAAAAISTTRVGAVPSVPFEPEVRAMLDGVVLTSEG